MQSRPAGNRGPVLSVRALPSFEARLRPAPQDEGRDAPPPHPEAPGASRASKDGEMQPPPCCGAAR
ncbi:hypothetical protein DDZ18_13110 [Marinicauda salina]|uniref:Uncharacterized protein n=1 Tax=Marinicauda salina TaxID=2135793 RepID=A0A2U2BQS8_9PROT|nr:hypothetical protein DDZ18_13110 [Marinicauda salina]